jgi:hypothetical protein
VALEQARLLVEVARRVAKPVEALPPGSRAAARLTLYRDAVYWALVAGHPAAEVPPDLRTAWLTQGSATFAALASDPNAMRIVERALLEVPPTSLAVTEADADTVGAFAEALVDELDAPRERVERIRGQRWARFIATACAFVLLGYGVRVAALGPNLAADKPFHPSTSWSGCVTDPACVGLAFHTDFQNEPWAVLDLGRRTTFHRVEVTNRQDCCSERAVPLVVEVGDDEVHWREIARRDEQFSTWTIKLTPLTARYLRFKVTRQTTFHLQRVAVR